MFDPLGINPVSDEEPLTNRMKQLISLEHGTIGVTVHVGEVEIQNETLPLAENIPEKTWEAERPFVMLLCERDGGLTLTVL